MLSGWNAKGGPYKDALNNVQKYVVSSNPMLELQWPNSTLLHKEAKAEIADLKKRPGGNLVIMGSGELIRSIMPSGLVDEFFLMIHPIVLGSGTRLFDSASSATELTLVHSETTPTGVILASFKAGTA